MRLLEFLVYAFINTFGITQPTPEGARRAARWLGVVLLVAAVVAVGVVMSLHGLLTRQ